MAIGALVSDARARERESLIDNLLVWIHFITEMIQRTGLAPWEVELPFPGSLISTFLARLQYPSSNCLRQRSKPLTIQYSSSSPQPLEPSKLQVSDDLLRARDLLAAAELLERDAAAWDNVNSAWVPLSSEHGTHKTVKARFWPWLSGKSPLEGRSITYTLHPTPYTLHPATYTVSLTIQTPGE